MCHLEKDNVRMTLGFKEIFFDEPCHMDEFAIITVPFLPVTFDFSELQKQTNKKVKKKNYWISPPDHLNYFNKNSFIYFAKKLGFNLIDAMADFPIELFLLSKNFDYTKDPRLGKMIHHLRCEIYSYLYSNCDDEKLYNFSKVIYELNIGRDNFYLLKK